MLRPAVAAVPCQTVCGRVEVVARCPGTWSRRGGRSRRTRPSASAGRGTSSNQHMGCEATTGSRRQRRQPRSEETQRIPTECPRPSAVEQVSILPQKDGVILRRAEPGVVGLPWCGADSTPRGRWVLITSSCPRPAISTLVWRGRSTGSTMVMLIPRGTSADDSARLGPKLLGVCAH